jgi:O-antigen/teichoic acid export membrane protein
MSLIKKNIIANLIGRVWSAAFMLLLVQFYTKFLGLEPYGVIGFYTTLLASLAILDLGLSTTLNRELARARAVNKEPLVVRNLVFTLECIYRVIGLVIAAGIIVCASVIANQWIKA